MTESIRGRDDREEFCNPFPPDVENYFNDRIPTPVLDSLAECLKENEKYSEEEFLTNLVRETYVQYLKNCLISNYKSWLVATGGGMELTDKILTRCAHVMERSALRQCMISSLYRQAISEIISNVKKSTDRWKLHEDLLSALNWSSSVRDAWTQVENIEKTTNVISFASIACQTEDISETPRAAPDSTGEGVISPSKVASRRLVPGSCTKSSSKSSNSSLIVNAAIEEFPLSNSSVSIPQPVPPLDSSGYGPGSNIASLPPLPSSDDLFSGHEATQLPIPQLASQTIVTPSSKENNTKKRISELDLDESFKRRKCTLLNEPKKKPLDERLKKFEALFGDNSCDLPVGKSKRNKSTKKQPHEAIDKFSEDIERSRRYAKFFMLINWKSEAIAQTCQLNKILSLMPLAKRKALLKRFEELFGIDGTEARLRLQEQRGMMVPEEFNHCRQRAANLVCAELGKCYDRTRISSRPVFKAIAQEITSIILTVTFAPDLDIVKEYVDGAFANGANYSTIEDVSLIAANFR